MLGIASSNIRRQIKRLRSMFIVEKVVTRYRITEFTNLTDNTGLPNKTSPITGAVTGAGFKEYIIPSLIFIDKPFSSANSIYNFFSLRDNFLGISTIIFMK